MEIQVFQDANSSQTNAYSDYSNYSYSGLIPNELALSVLALLQSKTRSANIYRESVIAMLTALRAFITSSFIRHVYVMTGSWQMTN